MIDKKDKSNRQTIPKKNLPLKNKFLGVNTVMRSKNHLITKY